MSQRTLQASLFSAEDEQSQDCTRLVVPPEQLSRLQAAGGNYIANFITPEEETDLLAAIDGEMWKNDLQRRVQHYGYRYDYTERNINADNKLGSLPPWVEEINNRLMKQDLFISKPDQLIVNEYMPGQGIAPHTDRDCFGPVVASLSLGSDCMMRIRPHNEDKQDAFDIVLLRLSLVVLQGQSRDVWRHSIAPRQGDQQDGCKIPRQRRVSLTFRTIKK